MDVKMFLTTFVAVFVAELGDKTQLAGLDLSAKSGKPVSVLLGSVSGYFLVTLITVIIGSTLGKYINPEIIKYVGASLFIILGILMFMGKV